MAITSTVPAAIGVLQAYMNQVASQNPVLNPAVYVGSPTENVRNNYLMVGAYENGDLISPETYHWNAIPGAAKLRSEAYAINGTIRVWAGATDAAAKLSRLSDAFTLLNGLHQQIVSDIGGTASGLTVTSPAVAGAANLSPSGSWGDLDVSMLANEPLGGRGWGVVLGFELHVINAQIQG